MADIISVSGTNLPHVREYTFTLEDIDGDNSTRTEAGIMHREIIRKNVYHGSFLHICTETEMMNICDALMGGEEATIEANVLCPGKGTPSADITAYVSKLETKLILYQGQSGNEESWWQVSYQLIEV